MCEPNRGSQISLFHYQNISKLPTEHLFYLGSSVDIKSFLFTPYFSLFLYLVIVTVQHYYLFFPEYLQQALYCQNESSSKNKPRRLQDILLKAQYDNKIKSLQRPHFKLFWSFNRGPLVVKVHVTIPNSVVRGIACFSFQRILQINKLNIFYFTLLHQDVLRTLSVSL